MNAYATLKQFGLPAVAGSLAVCVSHPLELTKSWRAGGVGNLWSGLRFGVAREFAFNCARIGSFEPALAVVGHPMAAGFLCGSLGGCVANPVEVLKVRFQALGGATGHQHAAFSNAGFWASLRRLVADEGWRASPRASACRRSAALGPGTQLPAYYELKRRCAAAGLDADSPAVHGCCSAASAGVSIAFCNPADVVRTQRVRDGFRDLEHLRRELARGHEHDGPRPPRLAQVAEAVAGAQGRELLGLEPAQDRQQPFIESVGEALVGETVERLLRQTCALSLQLAAREQLRAEQTHLLPRILDELVAEEVRAMAPAIARSSSARRRRATCSSRRVETVYGGAYLEVAPDLIAGAAAAALAEAREAALLGAVVEAAVAAECARGGRAERARRGRRARGRGGGGRARGPRRRRGAGPRRRLPAPPRGPPREPVGVAFGARAATLRATKIAVARLDGALRAAAGPRDRLAAEPGLADAFRAPCADAGADLLSADLLGHRGAEAAAQRREDAAYGRPPPPPPPLRSPGASSRLASTGRRGRARARRRRAAAGRGPARPARGSPG
ncbi:mitochondrial oxoglutarate transporter [Aureococcus anophagefferens]|uniref:Mitochondrial oxoglutarate transporter n=1 Tax=Aureococcus anophagefferens TaxID=44056 RepID=A0ABR1GFE8_AURAN